MKQQFTSLLRLAALAFFALSPNSQAQSKFPEDCAGTYTGLVGRLETGSGLGGRVQVTVSKTQAFTGTVDVGSKRYSLKGKLAHASESYYTATVRAASGWLSVYVVIDCAKQELTGETALITGEWKLAHYGKKVAPAVRNWVPLHWRGLHYVQLTPPWATQGGPTYPQGQGLGNLVIAHNGSYTWSGRLADGTRYSTSGRLTASGEFAFRVLLNGGRGSLQGWMKVEEPTGYFSGVLEWVKYDLVRNKVIVSKGFPLHQLEVGENKHQKD